MTSFDIEFPFSNIPLEETIDICVDKLFENNTKVNNLTKGSFQSLLELATLDSFFIFDGKYYKQKDGVAMGSLLGPTLANVFLCHFKEQWMSDCPIEYKLFLYRRYVDDTFLLFSFELHITKLLTKPEYLCCKKKGISVFPFLSKKSLEIKKQLQNAIERTLPYCKLKIIFKSPSKIVNHFYFKDALPKKLCSGIWF